MAYGVLNKYMDAAAELGRNPGVSTRFSLSLEMSRLTRDGTARLARPNNQARTGTNQIFIFPFQLTTSRIGNLTRLILTLAICDDHTYSKDST